MLLLHLILLIHDHEHKLNSQMSETKHIYYLQYIHIS